MFGRQFGVAVVLIIDNFFFQHFDSLFQFECFLFISFELSRHFLELVIDEQQTVLALEELLFFSEPTQHFLKLIDCVGWLISPCVVTLLDNVTIDYPFDLAIYKGCSCTWGPICVQFVVRKCGCCQLVVCVNVNLAFLQWVYVRPAFFTQIWDIKVCCSWHLQGRWYREICSTSRAYLIGLLGRLSQTKGSKTKHDQAKFCWATFFHFFLWFNLYYSNSW